MEEQPGARLCLATGKTTQPIYQRTTVGGDPVIFLLDEFGGLPAGDPGRCESHFRRDFPQAPFAVPDVDDPGPGDAAGRYGSAIRAGGIDLAVVGLGRNGHLGMNEPGSEEGSLTRVVDLAEATSAEAMSHGAATRPTWGITVGIAELMDARELWLVVTGAHKAEILETSLQAPIGPPIPASFLRNHRNARIIADPPAAERI